MRSQGPFRQGAASCAGSRHARLGDIPAETRQARGQPSLFRDGIRLAQVCVAAPRIAHRTGLPLDGTHPVVLYGYGGFGTSVPPLFWLSMVPFLEAGGIFAVASIRGGGEYGAAWHQAAVREHRQTSFNDFIDAAEWLIAQRYTRPSRLGIMGASNGGLLVAACLTQRPELYGAAISQVPIIDMLRYQRFTVGQHLTTEFGNAEASADEFATLYAYSPLHRVWDGTPYPAALVTTADHDDRAVPLHAMKFVAALQTADPHGAPHLLRVERGAGHGLGKPAARLIEEMADTLAFLFHVLGIPNTRPATGQSRTILPENCIEIAGASPGAW